MNFKVGDVCVGQHIISPGYNGMECVVLAVDPRRSMLRNVTTGKRYRADMSYRVRWADGDFSWQQRHELRLKRPPDEPKSDFTPAEDDFSEWLKSVRKVGA